MALLAFATAGCVGKKPLVDAGPQQAPQQTLLTNDASRTALALRALREDPQYQFMSAAPRKDFVFPNDADDIGIYGLDVSHHNEDNTGRLIDWSLIPPQKIVFTYIKATQGTTFLDGRFHRTWDSIGAVRAQGKTIYRGAYHFLSASSDPVAQANNYLHTVGTIGPNDLPPCLDVEWDGETDAWAAFSEDQIAQKISQWIDTVEAATGRKVVIYTSAAWWNVRAPHVKKFADHKIWVADYGGWQRSPQAPHIQDGYNWALWQFTETGKTSTGGLPGQADVSLFKGKLADFQAAFGLRDNVPPPPPTPPQQPPTAPPPSAPPPQSQTPTAPTPPPPAPAPEKSFWTSLFDWF